MPDDSYTDIANAKILDITEDGQCLRLELLTFDGTPVHATVTVPKGAARKGLESFFAMLVQHSDVYVNLLDSYHAEHGTPKKGRPKPTIRRAQGEEL
jgi:hypothetical protein